MAIFFSAAGFFHQYYLSTLAPAICAMFGIGVVVMWNDFKRSVWRGWLLPVALLLTAAEQIHIILATNKGVMAMGGFSGSDPILTTNQLASLVANGTVRYFLLNGSGGAGGGPGGGQSSLTTWVTQHCTTVPTNQ